jgi:hypothetical protein
VETANVLNQINPDFIRLRTLQVRRGTALYNRMEKGEFHPLGDEDVLTEIRLFIEHLDGIQSKLINDHIRNLLEEVQGKLPEDKDRMLATIDRYFSLPARDRMIYRLGRWQGLYRRLDDLAELDLYRRLEVTVDRYLSEDAGKLDRDLDQIRQNYV